MRPNMYDCGKRCAWLPLMPSENTAGLISFQLVTAATWCAKLCMVAALRGAALSRCTAVSRFRAACKCTLSSYSTMVLTLLD
jgi:hypothetical protein